VTAYGHAAVNISSLANGALGEHLRHDADGIKLSTKGASSPRPPALTRRSLLVSLGLPAATLVEVALHVLNRQVSRLHIALQFGRRDRQGDANSDSLFGMTFPFCPHTSCKGEDGREERDEDDLDHLNLQGEAFSAFRSLIPILFK
jgi:hypothetical protein